MLSIVPGVAIEGLSLHKHAVAGGVDLMGQYNLIQFVLQSQVVLRDVAYLNGSTKEKVTDGKRKVYSFDCLIPGALPICSAYSY